MRFSVWVPARRGRKLTIGPPRGRHCSHPPRARRTHDQCLGRAIEPAAEQLIERAYAARQQRFGEIAAMFRRDQPRKHGKPALLDHEIVVLES